MSDAVTSPSAPTALSARIAEVVLIDPRATAVTVTVRKLRPPVPQHLETSGVRIRRTR